MTCQASDLVPFQTELARGLPVVFGNADYLDLRTLLENMDAVLIYSSLEERFIALVLEQWLKARGTDQKQPSARQKARFELHAQRALRCVLAMSLLQMPYRAFSARLADSPLLQNFCKISALDQVKVPSKSTVHRYFELVDEAGLRGVVEQMLGSAAADPTKLGLDEVIDLDAYFMDSTCLPANIHFPVDWTLLRDGVRTLTLAIMCVRKHGLKNRIEKPENFLKEINTLAMEMTHCRGQADSKKERKGILRQMKKLVDVVSKHAKRYREILESRWEETDWTRKQAQQVINRIEGVLELLPKAKKQAHERIIGERLVKNSEKILSLYEPQTRVIKRGKAGADVEFGNVLLLGENPHGLVIDWQLYDEVPSDTNLVEKSLDRVEAAYQMPVQMLGGDRGFDSQSNRELLDKKNIYNGICPRSPAKLKERLNEDEALTDCLRRRAQTEGRIAILKNRFLGAPLRAKGFEHRKLAVTWGVLTHNLWVLAKMRRQAQAREADSASLAA